MPRSFFAAKLLYGNKNRRLAIATITSSFLFWFNIAVAAMKNITFPWDGIVLWLFLVVFLANGIPFAIDSPPSFHSTPLTINDDSVRYESSWLFHIYSMAHLFSTTVLLALNFYALFSIRNQISQQITLLGTQQQKFNGIYRRCVGAAGAESQILHTISICTRTVLH